MQQVTPDRDRRVLDAIRAGKAAAMNGESVRSCPYVGERNLPMAAAWRNAWCEERDQQRKRREAKEASARFQEEARLNRECGRWTGGRVNTEED